MKKIIFVLLLLSLLVLPVKKATAGVCHANPATSLLGPLMFTNIDWAGMFPIRLGGVPVVPGIPDDQDSQPATCVCTTPIPRIGLSFSIWLPQNITEVTADPFCFQAMGINIPNPAGVFGEGSIPKNNHRMAFYQAHYYTYPVMAILGLFTDVACLQASTSEVTANFITEVDPMWQSDILADFASPEAILFSNPVLTMSCIADSVSAQVYQPLNFMFWCMGSWGSVYPVDGDVGSGKDNLESAAAVGGKTVYWMHHILLQWATAGPPTYEGACQDYPDPIWQKSQVRFDLALPIPVPMTTPIGQTSLIWSHFQAVPFIGQTYDFVNFNEVDCCLL